ncbi:MAG: hemolysin family protein [Opitutaceae bacterium]|nr:hemolysin family protein [Opitutaceae bacterium]
MSGITTQLFLLGFLLVANGLFAMAEIAIVSARKARLRQLANEGDEGAQAALELGAEPTRFLSTVQVGITLCGILAGAFGGSTVADEVSRWLLRFPQLAPWADYIAFGGVVGLITFFSIILGELVPKRIALNNPERMARLVAGPLQGMSRVVAPVINLLSAATDLLLKPFGLTRRRETPVSDEEVNILIEQGLQAGVFHKAEKEMVEGVLGLDQLPVTAIMTPRPKIVFLNIGDSEEVNWRKIVASGHSHFPVYQDNRDQVLGMVAVKALWAHSAISVPTSLKNLLTPPLVVPETMNCIQLLEAFKKSSRHTALVADEFGSIQGMVTLIDVLEAIVGDLPAQGRRDQPEARQREDGSWLMDATLAVNELKAVLHLDELPQEAEADYQTLGGLVMTQFGRIPAAGDHFTWHGWRFEVVDMDRHRIDKVLVSRVPPPSVEQKKAG